MSNESDVVVFLSDRECWDRLAEQQLGRLVTRVGDVLDIFPVNYIVDGESLDSLISKEVLTESRCLKIVAEIADACPGNVLALFPSYRFVDEVRALLDGPAQCMGRARRPVHSHDDVCHGTSMAGIVGPREGTSVPGRRTRSRCGRVVTDPAPGSAGGTGHRSRRGRAAGAR